MTHQDQPLGNSKYIYSLNKIRIVRFIRNSDGVSRAEIARATGLSAPTVSRIVDDLIHEHLVVEVGSAPSHGGRRPTILKFRGTHHAIIGIDLGTTNILGVLTDLDAKVLCERSVPTRVETGFASVIERTAGVVSDLKSSLGPRGDRILGIGMAVAGLINNRRNIVEVSPDFHWTEADVAREMARWHQDTLLFDNVTRVMAIGEMFYGIGRKRRNFLCVNVGYGIGAGIVIDGKPLYGATGMAGEFGHIPMARNGTVRCDCGRMNCLEALASGNAIAKSAQAAQPTATSSSLTGLCGGDIESVDARLVADAARQGDPLARGIFDGAVETLGLGIAGMINIFSPEAVVIGGGVAQAGGIFFDTIRRVVGERAFPNISRKVEILPATFGTKAAVMGAVSLILNAVLNLNMPSRSGPPPAAAL